MIILQKRKAMTAMHALVLVPMVVFVALLAASIRADEIDDKINELNHQLLDAQIEAVERSLIGIRELAGDLVKSGDARKDPVLAREKELVLQLNNLRIQKGGNAEPVALRKLEKEFEAIEDRGGWWWLEQKNPDKRGPWYRLDRNKKRFVHWFVNQTNGKSQVSDEYSPKYEILGTDENDGNIILIKMIYPPKGTESGDQSIMRFNRTTGVIETTYGWYAEPKRRKD